MYVGSNIQNMKEKWKIKFGQEFFQLSGLLDPICFYIPPPLHKAQARQNHQ